MLYSELSNNTCFRLTMSEAVYIGVDVGTSSVRAYAVGASGQSRAHQTVKISIHNPKKDQYQQSSEEIWAAVCSAVKVKFLLGRIII